MKNLFTVVFFTLIYSSLSAQIHKGSVLLGGTVGFNNISAEGASVTTIELSPSVGYFLTKRFALGGDLDISILASEDASVSTIGLSPYARYYFNGSGNARFFGQAQIGFQVDGGGNGDLVLIYGLSAGMDFFLNDHVAIEGALGFTRYQDPESEGGFNTIGLNFGIAAFIGRDKTK